MRRLMFAVLPCSCGPNCVGGVATDGERGIVTCVGGCIPVVGYASSGGVGFKCVIPEVM